MEKTMKHSLTSLCISLFVAASLQACTSTPSIAVDPSLVATASDKVDHLWIKPGVDFLSYQALMLDKVEVSYREDAYRFSKIPKDELKARLDSSADTLKTMFPIEFGKQIEYKKRYQMVDQASPGTLRLTPKLQDVYITNPDETLASTQSTVLSKTAGDITLVLEIRDGITGELIAVVEDFEESDSYQMERQGKVNNYKEARLLIQHWANLFSDGLLDKN